MAGTTPAGGPEAKGRRLSIDALRVRRPARDWEYGYPMTTTPQEPTSNPDIVPAGAPTDPRPGPTADPDPNPSGDPTTDADPVDPGTDPTDPDGYSHGSHAPPVGPDGTADPQTDPDSDEDGSADGIITE